MLDNGSIAELLAREAESAKPPVNRALKKAARAALSWREEVLQLASEGRSLTELRGIGPYLEKLVLRWLDSPPRLGEIPGIRRNFITQCEANTILASHPEWKPALRGDLQMHTEWSDGSGSVREMAEAAQERGYDYIGITDHAQALKIAGGMSEAELEEQGCEIETINQSLGRNQKPLRVLRSIELNLDVQGSGDMGAASLSGLDVVLGAFHSALRKTDDQTPRYLAALQNPDLHILGHPRGRIYNHRWGLRADWPRVFAVAAKLDKAVEIDCYPDRQDLDVELLGIARDAGVRVSLGTDAHHPGQLQFIEFGLAAAILARIPKERVLNFMACDQLLSWAGRLKSRVYDSHFAT
jgi:histidinol phosphatase-like PHP family hydrolase